MKKIIVLAVAILLPLISFGQVRIDTKKMKISDFTQKVTKVVLTGSPLHDGYMKKGITAKWHVSPFEFCTLDEYETLKTDDSYYFLLTTKGQFKKETEPGITFLSLVKGGKDAAGIEDMIEIVSFPFASAIDPSGREYSFLQAILDIIQGYTISAMEKDIDAYTGLPNYSLNISKAGHMTLVFSENDLASDVTEEVKNLYFDDKVLVLDEDDADEYLESEKANTLVSYTVCPSKDGNGYCYKMLIEPQTNSLYYFRKHKMSKKFGAGFLAEDVKRVTAPRKK